MKTIDALIAEVPAFAGLAPAQLELIAGCATNARVGGGRVPVPGRRPGRRVLRDPPRAVALELHVPARDAVTSETLHDGDLLGWSWLFPPYRWEFDGRARSRTRR